MILYPDLYIENVKKIDNNLLKTRDIKGLILDIDNTLIDYDRKLLDGCERWCSSLKKQGIKMCIVSNTNKEEKVKKVAEELGLEYIFFAHKPGKKGLRKAISILNLEAKEIAIVGDQIFTDVFGGNRMGMISILTKPIDKRDILITKIKRPFERIVIKKYIKKVKKNEYMAWYKQRQNKEKWFH